ncbi:MAG: hypothetical protein ABMA26_11085 [Limisphaerales bacterium]
MHTPPAFPDWPAVIARFTHTPSETSSDALPSPVQLSRWTVAHARSLLEARTDPSVLLINGRSALDEIAALPGDRLIGSLLDEVELGIPEQPHVNGAVRPSRSLIRMPLADAVDFVVRECFSTLHGLRLRRLRLDGTEGSPRKPDGNKLPATRFA